MRPVVLIVALAACSNSDKPAPRERPSPRPAQVHIDAAHAAVAKDSPCGPTLAGAEIAPGMRVERLRAAEEPPLPVGDRCLLVVRIDPKVYRLKLLAESEHGERLSAPDWAAKFGLAAAINASMFHEGGQSTGLLVNGSHVNNANVNSQFGAFMAFDPVDPTSPPVVMAGQGCEGFDLAKLRKDYRVVIQNYRLLDCDGKAIEWKDRKIYSAAAVGLDEDDRVVFALQRTPYRPTEFAKTMASDQLRLRAAMYVEGGPEASVYAKGTDVVINAIGSYESLFNEADTNVRAWPIPNIIGAIPR